MTRLFMAPLSWDLCCLVCKCCFLLYMVCHRKERAVDTLHTEGRTSPILTTSGFNNAFISISNICIIESVLVVNIKCIQIYEYLFGFSDSTAIQLLTRHCHAILIFQSSIPAASYSCPSDASVVVYHIIIVVVVFGVTFFL